MSAPAPERPRLRDRIDPSASADETLDRFMAWIAATGIEGYSASEKFFALCDELAAENVGMRTGDARTNGAAPVICCTAEVLMNMALRQGEAADAPYGVSALRAGRFP